MIRLIVAVDSKNGIGKNGKTPWNLPNELAYFHEKTRGSAVLMGHTTHLAIARVLSERQNFVCTKTKQPEVEGITWVYDPTELLQDFRGELWVIGGQQIYELALPYADEIYITKIKAVFDCDRFFPEIPANFELAVQSETQTENGLYYVYQKWQKIKL